MYGPLDISFCVIELAYQLLAKIHGIVIDIADLRNLQSRTADRNLPGVPRRFLVGSGRFRLVLEDPGWFQKIPEGSNGSRTIF